MVTDQQLYDSLRSGNEKALRQLLDRYYIALCKYAESIVEKHEFSEEIVQDLFVKIWRKETGEISNLKGYLFRSVRNASLNLVKANQKRRYDVLDDATDLPDFKPDELELQELQTKINSLVQALPQKCREIFLLSREEELSYKEIAEKLDISIKTVENQMGIALKKLRNGLANDKEFFMGVLLLFAPASLGVSMHLSCPIVNG